MKRGRGNDRYWKLLSLKSCLFLPCVEQEFKDLKRNIEDRHQGKQHLGNMAKYKINGVTSITSVIQMKHV